MCEFAGNRHKQFNTNYLYGQSGYCVCILFLVWSVDRAVGGIGDACLLFGKENKAQPSGQMYNISSCRCHHHHLTERALIIALTLEATEPTRRD